MKRVFFYLVIVLFSFVSCSKDNDGIDPEPETVADEYYIQYIVPGTSDFTPRFEYKDADGQIKESYKVTTEIAIGPVPKGFTAYLNAKSFIQGRAITIAVSKNKSPWLVKASKKLYSGTDSKSIEYTIDF